MDLRKCFLTQNDCYKEARTIKPVGIVVHSTGANNKTLKRYVQPDDGILGVNKYKNDWNHPGINKCVNAFIGCNSLGTVSVYQTLPWTMRPWGCGSGINGSYNNSHIQFEICEDALNDETYFKEAFKAAAELCAYLCKEYSILPIHIVSHHEAYEKGYASGHADCDHWLKKFGKNMDWFREQVNAILEGTKSYNNSEKTNDAIAWDFLEEKGFNDYAIAGIMGNIKAESNFNPKNLQNSFEKKLGLNDATYTDAVDAGRYADFVHDSAGYGLCQWTYWSRKEKLLSYARIKGKSIGDLMMQLEFMFMEISSNKPLMLELSKADSVRTASDLILLNYEKPAKKDEESVKVARAKNAQTYFDMYARQVAGFQPYKVKVTVDALNIRKKAGVIYEKVGTIKDHGVYTIVEESGVWGKLKSGAGWICLSYTKKV